MAHPKAYAAGAALLAIAGLAIAADPAFASGYGEALGYDSSSIGGFGRDVLLPFIKLAGYIMIAYGAVLYFQNEGEDGPAASRGVWMMVTGALFSAFEFIAIGQGSLNWFIQNYVSPGVIVFGLVWMANGAIHYFKFRELDGVRANKGLERLVSGAIIGAIGAGVFTAITISY